MSECIFVSGNDSIVNKIKRAKIVFLKVAIFTTHIFYQKVAGGNQTNWTGIASASIDGKHSKYTPSSLSTVNDSNNLSAVDTNIANQEGIIAFLRYFKNGCP